MVNTIGKLPNGITDYFSVLIQCNSTGVVGDQVSLSIQDVSTVPVPTALYTLYRSPSSIMKGLDI